MKQALLTPIFITLIGLSTLLAQSPNDFVTTWQTDNPGTSNSTSITIPTTGGGYNYDVDWDNDGNFDQFGITGDVTHDFGTADTYTIRIRGTFPRIYFFEGDDPQKLLSVDQWGNIAWTDMYRAFWGCTNLAVNATDAPDLSGVSSLEYMFYNCSSFNQSINHWNVSNITSMNGLFWSATAFNQPLDNWDMLNVESTRRMFQYASSFNQDISGWETDNVNTMFLMFLGASSFNQYIGGWNVGAVTDMQYMFRGASSFNQDIGGWNVGAVTDMQYMFYEATSFDQNIGGWDVSWVSNMTNMFSGVTLSTANYDALLIGWSQQNLYPGVTFSGGNSQYCAGAAARQSIIDNEGWTITDGGAHCLEDDFVTTWKTDNPGTSNSTSITIPTFTGETYSYDVDWDNDGTFDQFGITGDVTHDFGTPGNYTIRIRGSFPRIYFFQGDDPQKLLSVDQWGNNAWTSMEYAFFGCTNLAVNATDAPDLSGVNSLSFMFTYCSSFNQSINHWNVSTISYMVHLFRNATAFNQPLDDWDMQNVSTTRNMFAGATSFNQDISGWNVGAVTGMQAMFNGASSFDQDISGWNVGAVTDMRNMFSGASSFNQDISGWGVAAVTNMRSMFSGASSFNQNIGGWNTGNVSDMSFMFNGASSFNQNIGGWGVAAVSGFQGMFDGVTLSTANYDALLIGWSQQNHYSGLTFSGGNSQYCAGAAARQSIIDNFGWTITDGGYDFPCSTAEQFVTTWKTDNPGTSNSTSIIIPTFTGPTYNYHVDWGDGTITFGHTGDATHSYASAGTYTVKITGTFPRIYFHYGGDKEKLMSVEQWGNNAWADMEFAFFGCTNLVVNATDAPDLSGVNSLSFMFTYCSSFNQSINHWDVSNISYMVHMFRNASAFNQPLDNWDMQNVSATRHMFVNASSFNQDISGWDVSAVTDMDNMFEGVTLSTANYDALLIGWSQQNLQYGLSFSGGNSQYCAGADAKGDIINNFNWTITDGGYTGCDVTHFMTTWKTDNPGTSNNTSITIPTTGGGYNYDVDWDNDGIFDDLGITGDVTHNFGTPGTYTIRIRGSFPRIYFNNGGDRQKLLSVDQWGNIAWTNMDRAFWGCTNLAVNATDAPELSGVSSLSLMFGNCSSFNQSINHWDVGNILYMISMFRDATAFNQPLDDWQMLNVISTRSMFNGASSFNQDIGGWNTGNVNSMLSMFAGATSFNQDISEWEVGAVTDMQNMFFGASSFNQYIGGWNVSAVTNMMSMFDGASNFNQDISGWNVGNVSDMSSMFYGASSFNQDIGGWGVGGVSDMTHMFLGVTLSTANYDALLIGWSQQNLYSGVTFSGGNSQYCTGAGARQSIIDNFGWTITDGGYDIPCSTPDQFVTTWQTDNPGTSNSTSITIPTTGGGYNYHVDWGDGTITFGHTGDATHSYTSAGSYTVKIIGTFPRIYFNDGGDREKLMSVDQWGSNAWTSMQGAFFGCTNLSVNATDAPDLSGVTSLALMFGSCSSFNQSINHWDVGNILYMNSMFRDATAFNQPLDNWDMQNALEIRSMFQGATSFNQDISGWNTGNAYTMFYMFAGATSFNQDIGGWDVGAVADMTNMFSGVTLSTANYDALLIGWSQQSLQSGVTFSGGNSQYCDGADAKGDIINNFNWTITDGGYTGCHVTHFMTTWQTDNPGTSNSSSITIPTFAGQFYNYDVDWNNDGVFDNLNVGGPITHDFGTPGNYTIRIRGTYPAIRFGGGGDKDKILSVDQWGTIAWTTMENAFYGCSNLSIPAADAPDLSAVTSMTGMFVNATSFNSSINHWDVINVTSMVRVFNGASAFNQPLSDWDVDNVTSMVSMFNGASAFNQPLGSWEVGNVTTLFNMFNGASAFNQPLNDWDVSSVVNMIGTFRDASSFNQPLNNWDVGSVIPAMFMFDGATAFDQDIGNWDVSNIGSMANMFNGVTLSTANYDALLIGWSQLGLKSNVVFNAGSSMYCDGEAARQSIINTFNWTIADGGEDPTCLVLPVELISFSGVVTDSYNRLSWSTASEHNTSHFELERSEKALNDWNIVGNVQAQGESNTLQTYHFDDREPQAEAYYRLRMVDLDASFSYSNIVFLKNGRHTQNQVNVYPNPAGDFLHIQWAGVASYEAFLYNAAGQLLLNSVSPGQLELASFPAGIYLLRLRDLGSGKEVKKRIVHVE